MRFCCAFVAKRTVAFDIMLSKYGNPMPSFSNLVKKLDMLNLQGYAISASNQQAKP
jgi:hypothetical protein